MVGPRVKRQAVDVLRQEHGFGVTRACGLVNISRSLYGYRSRRLDCALLRQRIGELVTQPLPELVCIAPDCRMRNELVFHGPALRCENRIGRPATMLVLDGRMYLTTPGVKLLALDAATGKEIWRFDPWDGQGGRGVNRGVRLMEIDGAPRTDRTIALANDEGNHSVRVVLGSA